MKFHGNPSVVSRNDMRTEGQRTDGRDEANRSFSRLYERP
jgi:hypothetical protein